MLVWTLNAKDVVWLTVELADNSEETTSMCELEQLTQKGNKQENSNNQCKNQDSSKTPKMKTSIVWDLTRTYKVTVTVKPTSYVL